MKKCKQYQVMSNPRPFSNNVFYILSLPQNKSNNLTVSKAKEREITWKKIKVIITEK